MSQVNRCGAVSTLTELDQKSGPGSPVPQLASHARRANSGMSEGQWAGRQGGLVRIWVLTA